MNPTTQSVAASPAPTCPACQVGHGVATAVCMGHQTKTVNYQCDHCTNKWQAITRDK